MTSSLVITLVKVMFYEVDDSKKESCKFQAKIEDLLLVNTLLGILFFLAKLVKGARRLLDRTNAVLQK